jgi:hypothetical protein
MDRPPGDRPLEDDRRLRAGDRDRWFAKTVLTLFTAPQKRTGHLVKSNALPHTYQHLQVN